MLDFEDHAAARLVARLAREALFDAAHAEVPAYPQANLSPDAQAQSKMEPAEAAPAAPVSKRDFLRGRIGGSGHVDRR